MGGRMKHRAFWTAASRAAVALAFGWLVFISSKARAADAGAAPRRPNFIFVFTEDQRWDAMGVMQREQAEQARLPWLRTPNMDRLAAEGVRLRNAFVMNSLCSP